MLGSQRVLLSFIFGFIPVFIFAQNFPPCTAYDSSGKDTIVSTNSYSNSLYVGIDNPVEIVKSNVNCKNLVLKSSNGIVIKEDSYKYTIIPSKTGQLTIKLYQFDNGDTVLIFTKAMNVLMVPKPYITVDRLILSEQQSINRIFFIKNKLFEVHISDDFVDDSQWFKIKEISVGYVKGQFYTSKSCSGSMLTDEAVNLIQNAIPGKDVSFVFTVIGTGDLCIRMTPIKVKVY